jgi:hypothetical protein
VSEEHSGRETPGWHITWVTKREDGALINAEDGTPIEIEEKTEEARKREADENAHYQELCATMRQDVPREARWLFDVLARCLHSRLRVLMRHPAMGFTEKQIDRYAEACEDLLKQHENLDVIGPEVSAYADQLRDGVRNYPFDVRIAYAITGLVHERLSYYGYDDVEAIRAGFKRDPSFDEMWAILRSDLRPIIGAKFRDFEDLALGPAAARTAV